MKKTISLVLCVAMLMSSLSFCFPAFALEMDFNVESAENYAPTTEDLIGETAEGVTLAATAKAGDPGINIWTGTTAAFDFQDMTSANVGLAIETDAQRANEKVRVGGKEIFKTESENNYIAFGGVSYPQFYPLTDGVSVDSARPVKVSFDYRAAGATNVILVRNRDNALNPALKTMSLPAASGWTSYNVTVKGIDAGEGLKGYAKSQSTHPGGFSDDTTNIKNIYFIYGGTAPAVDFDNLSAKPYYKVSFYEADGTTLIGTEYVDPDETTYTVPSNGKYALKGTTTPVTTVTLANKDIELVATGELLKAGMPGVNVFTGTLDAYGFENPNYKHMYTDTRRHGIQADPADANNKVMWLGPDQFSNMSLTPTPLDETNKFYPIQFDVVPENDRPLTFSMDVKASKNNSVIYLYSGLDNSKTYNPNGWRNLKAWSGISTSNQNVNVKITYSDLCRYGFPLLCLANQHAASADVSLYIDNLKLIPDYKVTFYAADGKTVLHSEYVDGAETTYTISADATNKLDTEIYGGFAAKGTTEIVTGSVALNNYDLEFVAQLKPGAVEWKAGMPGVNLWTGTPAAYDFESDDNTSFTAKFRPVGGTTLEAYTSGGVATNVVKMSGGYPHFTTRLGTTPVVDKDRPVLVSYDYITPVSTQIRIIRNVINKTDPTLNQATTAVSANWSTHKDTVVGNSKPVTNVPGAENYNDDTQDIKNFWFMKPNDATGHVVYLDNISLIPYYKVTYYDYDGTTAIKTEYVAPDAGSITLPALDANIYKGYALKGTTNVVTSAKLRYEDLEFVALLKDGVSVATPVSYTGNDNKTTGVDYRFPGVSYTFDEELDDTTLAGVSAIEDASGWELSGDKKTLTVYPFARNAVPGETLTFARTPITSVKTASGKNVIFTEATLKFADSVDAYNLIPAGNMEGAYLPISAIPSQVADIEVRAETEGDNSYAAVRYLGEAAKTVYAYARTLVAFEEGANYIVYADVKILGGSPVAENIADVWSNMVYANADHAAKAVLTTETGWKEFTREFKTTGLVDSEEAIAFYSNPNGANVTEYAIDNLEVYKRAEVKFEESEFAPLKSGASNPVVEGKYPYIKGGAKNPDAKITLPTASDYYEATDARRTVSGWLGSDGVVYADGTVVDLAETFSITFQPNLVAAPGYKFITVKFEGDLAEAPAAVKGALEGDTVDLTKYYNVTASAQAIAAGKRFNGWSLTGEAKDIIDSFEIANALADSEDVITVKAVVNYDWNFAIPANHTGWKFDSGETKFENNMLVGKHINNGSHDTRFSNNNLAVPGGRVQSIIYVLDEDITYIDRKDHSAANITDMKIVATDNAIKYGVKDSNGSTFPLVETIYYGQGHARKATHTISTVKVSDLTDGFKAVTVTVYDTAAKKFVTSQPFDLTQKLTTADFDTNTTVNNAGLARLYSNVGLRYIHFADYPKYDTKTVAITDLETPETGKKPDTAATVAAGTVKTIKWSNLSASGNFKENTQYEVTVILEPEAGKRYADDAVFTLEGATATSTVINNDSTGEAVVTFKFDTATEAYKAFNFDLSTVTDIEVTSVDPIQLTANITEAEAGVDTRIVWSLVDGGNIAMITEDGLLTVSGAGTITVKAVSVYNENKAAEKTINITLANGMKTVQVSFAGDLATVPSAITKLSGSVISMTELYDATASTDAVAAGKRFNGWSTTGELADLIATNTWTVPAENTTLTAIVNYDLNLAIPANTANVSHSRGTVTYDAEKGMVFADHTAGQTKGRATDFFVEFRAYAPMKDFKGFEAYLADEFIAYADNDKSSFTTKKFTDQRETSYFYFSNSGGYHFTNPTAVAVTGVDGVEYAKYVSIANSHEKWINGNQTTYMRLDPFDSIITSAYVRYLRYIPYDVYEGDLAVTFDAPVTGKAPVTAAVNEIGVLKSFTVTPDVPAESGLYEGAKVYTATAVIEPADKSNCRFKDGVKVTIGGIESTDAAVAADGTVTATVTFPATDAYVDFDMTVESDALDGDTLVTDGTPVQFTAEFTYGNNGDQATTEEVIWSVDNTSVATIDENGVLTPANVGTVVVTAKSKYNLAIVRNRTVDIELADGTNTVEISFAGEVATLPATVTRISGSKLDITAFYDVTASATAVADAKRFNGWSTTGELKDLITTNTWTVPAENTTLYAIVNHDVNFAIPANMAGLDLSRSDASYEDGVVFVEYQKGWTASSGNPADVFIAYPSAKVPMEMYRGMEFYFLDDYTTFGNNNKEGAQDKKISSLTKGDAFYFSSTGGYHNVAPTISKVEGADGVDYAVFTAITNEHSNWINGQRTNFIRLDPMTAYADFRIRYLRFVPYTEHEGDIAVTFDAPATGKAPATATVNEIGVLKSFTVTPDVPAESGLYEGAKVYTATAVIEPADKSNYRFKDGVKVTIGGIESTDAAVAVDGTVTATVTFPATDAYVDFDMTVESDALDGDTLVTDGTPVQFTAEFTYGNNGDQVTTEEVIWSVDNTSVAAIDENGVLTPFTAGQVIVTAKSKYNLAIVRNRTVDIELADDATTVEISFAGDLAEIPATVTRISGATVDLTEFYNVTASATAVADAKRFNGWSTTGDLADLITTNTWTVPAENTTLYAIVNHDVNFAIPANMAGLDLSRSNASYEDGVVFAEYIKGWSSSDPKANAADVYMQYPSAKVPMEMYRGMEFYFLDDYTTFANKNKEGAQDKKLSSLTKGEAFYFSSTGGYHNVAPTISKVEGADGVDYAVFTAITNEHAQWIDGQRTNFIRLDPMTAYADFRIRYLRFVPYEVCEGDIEITADVPTTGVAVSDKTTVNEIGKVTEIAVDPDNFIKYTLNGKEFKNYVAGQAYKIVYTVKTADSAACFSDSVAATVNGYDAVVTLNASKTTAYVEYTFPATEAYTPIAVSITGPSEILTKGRGTQYRATITAPDGSAVVLPTTSVTWSVAPGDEGYATINAETGKLVPIRNAYTGLANESVTIVATSNYDGTTVATYDVQLKNQATEAIVNYNLMGGVPTAGGTTLDPTVGAGSIKLAEASSVARAGYHFVGWATSDESAETVDILTLTVEDDQNTSTTDVIDYTVYAVWQKIAHGWEFNSQAEVDAFTAMNDGHHTKRFVPEEGAVELTTIKAVDTYQYVSGLNIDTSKATTLIYRMKPNSADNVVFYIVGNSIVGDLEAQGKLSVFATPGEYPIKKLTAGVWNEVSFDLSVYSLWKGTVTKIRYDLFDNGALSTSLIDYIRFLEDYATVTYDANAGSDTVTGLPESGLVKFGGKVTPAEVPTRDGYIFTGWSKTADGSTAVKKEFGIVGDVTLYAIWEESNTTVEADGSIVVGAINPAADEVLLVKTDAGATVTLFGDDGAPLMTATAGSDGYAEFDLTTLSAPVTNATIATDAGNTLESATVTDAETADTITSVPKTEDTGAADDDDDDKPSSAPSTKVETVTKPGTIDPSTMYPEEEVEEEADEEFQFNGYPVVNTDELPYVDVNTGNWFYKEVESAYKLGFVKGKSVFTYDPNGNVTIAEAITFALRLNYGYNGKEMPEIAAEGDWYAPIVEAALEAGIIKKAQFTEYDVPALRKQVAAIMAKSVPSDYLGTKNMFTNIPDVNKKAPEFTAILKLYRAGVVMGSDDNYNFMPETNITRAEMSAIINRIAIPDNRKRIVTPEELEARRKSFTAEDIAKEATAGNCYSDKLSLKGGYATATGKSTDPIIYLTNLVPELDGANTGVIRIGLKTDAKPAPQLFFTVPGGGWAADRMLSGTKGADKGNGVVEYVFDTKSNTQFANTITGLRFDPFNAKDIEFAIAYVIVE